MTMFAATLRRFLALLTALSIPLCCCTIDSLIKDCEACRDQQASAEGSHEDDCAACKAEHRDANDHATPGESRGHPKHGKCACGRENKIGSFDGKIAADQPLGLPAYPLPDPAPFHGIRGVFVALKPDSWVRSRSAQTLLRQHCALIE